LVLPFFYGETPTMKTTHRIVALFLAAGAVTLGVVQYSLWFSEDDHSADDVQSQPPASGSAATLELSPQARRNLGLVVKPLALGNYWKSIQLPGIIVDRPGRTDRGVTSPIDGVVTAVHAYPGDTVQLGDVLFTIRPSSEYIHSVQAELFKSAREIQLLEQQKNRLQTLVEGGAVAGARIIEIDQELNRRQAAIEAIRQELIVRGLTAAQIESAAQGVFASTIDVYAHGSAAAIAAEAAHAGSRGISPNEPPQRPFEVQELLVSLGQQVAAGAILCLVSDRGALYVEGHAFKQDAFYLERAVRADWPVRVEFSPAAGDDWPPLEQQYRIHHLANAVDAGSRTFAFYIPLENQFRSYYSGGKEYVVWRFLPGERARVYVPIEELADVFVLPAAAVTREGPEAYVFRQNGNLFNRLSVHVLHEDRLHVVIANDGDVQAGHYVAQNAAASLNRVLKAQAAAGAPIGVHVHADGTIHGSH
jgi:biotin carboxyl carrier protein